MTLDPGPEVRAVWNADNDDIRALSHFDGHAQFDLDAWGARAYALFSDHGAVTPYGKRWLEWGCGGGAVTRVIERRAHPAVHYAIDINDAALCQVASISARVVPMHPDAVPTIASSSIDAIVSTSCFQHFPSTQYAIDVLGEMRRLAAPGARGLVQTRYYQPGDGHDPATAQCLPYAEAFIRYAAWQVPEFWGGLEQAGFTVNSVMLEPHRQYAWYSFEVAL